MLETQNKRLVKRAFRNNSPVLTGVKTGVTLVNSVSKLLVSVALLI